MAKAKAESILKAPTLKYLQSLQAELESLYKDQDTQIRDARSDRELLTVVPVDPKLRVSSVEVRDPTITDEGQRRVATMTINRPTCKVSPSRRGSDVSERNATLREQASEAILWAAGGRTPGMHTYEAVVDAAMNDGAAWTKLVFSKDLWDERYSVKRKDFGSDGDYDDETEEAKKRGGPPFEWVFVDPLTIYPVFAGRRLTEVLEVQERPRYATFRKYRLTTDDQGDIVPEELAQPAPLDTVDFQSKVTFLEWWSDTHCAYAIVGKNKSGSPTGRIVQTWKHGYGLGRPPYRWYYGVMMSHWTNRKVGWGISQSKRWLVQYRSFIATVLANVAARDALGLIYHEVPEGGAPHLGDDGKPVVKEDLEFGFVYHGRPGEKFTPIQLGQVSESLKIQLSLADAWIEKLETPRLPSQLSGMEGAGFAMTTALHEATLRDHPVVASLESGLTGTVEDMWAMIRHKAKEKVWAWRDGEDSAFIGLSPDDLKDAVAVSWQINVERPSTELIRIRAAHERLQAGTWGEQEAVEYLGDNFDEIRLSKARDRIRKQPWYLQAEEKQTAQTIGVGNLVRIAAQIAQSGGNLGGGVTPAMGNSMVPDQGQLAASPGGGGMAPANPPNLGTSPGAVAPMAGSAAGMQ